MKEYASNERFRLVSLTMATPGSSRARLGPLFSCKGRSEDAHLIPSGASQSRRAASVCDAAVEPGACSGTGGQAPLSARLRLAAENAGLPRPRARRFECAYEEAGAADGAGVYSRPPQVDAGSARAASMSTSEKGRCGWAERLDALTGMRMGATAWKECQVGGDRGSDHVDEWEFARARKPVV